MNKESTDRFVSSYLTDDGIIVVKVNGKLDGSTMVDFNQEVEKHFQQGQKKCILDGSQLTYVSSMGIGAIVSLQAKLRMQGGDLKLAAIQDMVADILRIVRLDQLVDIYEDVDAAKASFD